MKINLCTYNFTLLSPRGNHHKKFESYFSLLKFKQLVVASISLHMYSQEHICTHIYNFVFQNIILLFFLTALQNLYTSESFQVYRKVAKIIQRVSYIYQNFKIHTGTLLLIKLQTSPGFPQVPPRPPKHPLSVPGSHAGNPLHLVMTLPGSPLI